MPDSHATHGPQAGHPPATHEKTRAEMLAHTVPPGLKRGAVIAVCVLGAVVVLGVGWRLWKGHETRTWTDDQLVQSVSVIKLQPTTTGGALVLPGQLQAFVNAPIYAQVSGYVQRWFFDIGATVKKGQLLAQIDPRPYEAALAQAQGTLARDQATLANARTDLVRYQKLSAQNAISAQQLSTQQANVNALAGTVQTDRGLVDQARINLTYTRIVAPFDGVVTSRSIDVGNLVTVGNASPTPLFTVSDRSRLRVYVSVPQNYAGAVHDGMTVTFTVPDYPGQTFQASLVAAAGAVVQSTNTMLVQFSTDNAQGKLRPGSYASVKLPVPAGAGGITLPATTLVFRESGMQVAVVTPQNKIAMRTVTIVRDNGATVVIAPGAIAAGERIVDNPPDALQEGDTVQVSQGAQEPAPPAKPNSQ